MSGFVRQLFSVITIAGASTLISVAAASELRINNKLVTSEMLSAYAQAYIPPDQHCPPHSDSRVREEYVRMALLGKHAEYQELEKLSQRVTSETAFHVKKIEELVPIIEQYKPNVLIHRVYSKKRKRLVADLENIRADLKTDYDKKTRFYRNSTPAILNAESLTEDEKEYLLKMRGFRGKYASNVKNAISDEDITRRYELLVDEKDDQLVNVTLLKTRSALVVNKDREGIEKVTQLLKQNASGKEVSGAAGIFSAYSEYDEPIWTNATHSRSYIPTTPKPKADDVFSKLAFEMQGNRIDMLIYVYETRHYSKIGLNQDMEHHFSAQKYAKKREHEFQLERIYNDLWSKAKITFDGSPLKMTRDYASCQTIEQ